MTTTTAPITALGYQGDDPTVAAVRDSIYGPHLETHRKAREIILGLGDVPQDHMSSAEEAGLAPDLLRGMLAAVGMPAQDIAADIHLRGALCDAAHIGAHHLHAVWTGNFDLVIWALLTLGNGSQYQRQCMAELNIGAALGVLVLTEAAGTNGADQQTEARWDAEAGGYRLTTPHIGAVKLMPNVAAPTVPKIVVVTARLLEYDPELGEDRDQGVLAFLVRLRTEAGLAEGVEVVALSAKLGAAMDHGAIRFNGTLVPADGLLAGDWGRVGKDGRFLSDVEIRQRFHRTIRPLQGGRLDLATSGQAAALAKVAAMVGYKAQRPHGDSDDVLRDLATVAAHAYAGSVLGRMVRDMAARAEDLPALWFMVVKPTLTAGAEQILLTCRRLAGAQGHLRVNYIPDSLANQAGAGTAEGDNRVLLIAAGRAGRTLSLLTLDGAPVERPWWLELIIEREEILGTDLDMALGADHFEPDGLAVGRDSAQVDLAQTTGVRLTASAAFIAAESMTDPGAAALARSAAAVVALRYLYEHSGWYNARELQTPHQAQQVLTELREHRLALAERLPIFVAGFDIPVLPGAPIFAPDYLESVADWTGWPADSFPRRR
ncbi:hypothetical protein [Nocardia carnea]|uniref:acyl-CoA dehydrogenase family protein n=1 Tax=Nocardia carnea TaxID=37328 RepID=UPI0024561DE9|nr:hypothetical protein [Nocardia carnea]